MPLIRPSLNLNFKHSKQLDPRVTFSRSSVATAISQLGVIKKFAANQPRFDYEPCDVPVYGSELAPQVNNFTATTGFSVSSGTLSVSGGALIWTSAAAGSATLTFGGAAVVGSTYRLAANASYSTSLNHSYWVGGSAAVPGYTGLSATFETISGLNSAPTTQPVFGLQVIFTAANQVVTINAVAARQITDYSARKGDARGLLIEEARTNDLKPSGDITKTAAWFERCNMISGFTAPDGSASAVKITESALQGVLSHGVGSGGWSSFNGKTVTASVYAKAEERHSFVLWIDNGAGIGVTASFDLVSRTTAVTRNGGVNFSGVSSAITEVGNGWYRCSLTATNVSMPSGTWGQFRIYLNKPGATSDTYGGTSWAGDNTSGMYFWGAQLEQGAFPTSYISTDPSGFGTRTSIASYFDQNGIMQYATSGTLRTAAYNPTNLNDGPFTLYESSVANVIPNSERIGDSFWSVNGTIAGAIRNFGVAPDGTVSTTRVICGVSQTGFFGYPNAAASTILTLSAFVKQSGLGTLKFGCDQDNGSVGKFASYTPSTNTWSSIGAGVTDLGSVSVGNGWYRIWVTYITASATNSIIMYQDGATTLDMEIWGVQAEANGGRPSSYIPSTTTFTSRASTGTYIDSTGKIATAAANVARMSYNPNNLSIAPKLLIEPVSTNLVTQSALTSWGATSTTITQNAALAPDGTTSAAKVNASVSGAHYVSCNQINFTGSTVYTISVFGKAAEYTALGIVATNAASNIFANFDLTTGACNTSGSTLGVASCVSVGNGWYRCALTYTVSGGGTNNPQFRVVNSYGSGDLQWVEGGSTNGIYMWGAQIEQGQLTSYIPTSGSTVTRATDVYSVAASTRASDGWSLAAVTRNADLANVPIGSWFRNKFEGTLVATYGDSCKTGGAAAQLSSGDGNYAYLIAAKSAMYINNGGGYTSVSPTRASRYRHASALSWTNAGVFTGSIDGIAPPFTNTQANGLPNVTGGIRIGSDNHVSSWVNGHVESIQYYPKNMTNRDMQVLSQLRTDI